MVDGRLHFHGMTYYYREGGKRLSDNTQSNAFMDYLFIYTYCVLLYLEGERHKGSASSCNFLPVFFFPFTFLLLYLIEYNNNLILVYETD